MSVTNIDEYYAGDTLKVRFTVQQSDGSPQDLTDCQIIWGISRVRQLGAPLVIKSNGNGITVVDEAGGVCDGTIEKGELVAVGDLFHELEITLPDGQSFTYSQGLITSLATVFPN